MTLKGHIVANEASLSLIPTRVEPKLRLAFRGHYKFAHAFLRERQLRLRVVRHLPVQHHEPAHDKGLRAGVGQASKEETAECAAADGEGYRPMAIRNAWPELAP